MTKEYKDFTEHERERYNSCWVTVLDRHCSADDEGNRPCDRGVPCDHCYHNSVIQHEFAEMLVSENVPLTPADKLHLVD